MNGIIFVGSKPTQDDLPTDLVPDDAGKAFFVSGSLHIWDGRTFQEMELNTQEELPVMIRWAKEDAV